MSKKLPEIFHNTIDKEIKNNENVFYSANDKKEEIIKDKKVKEDKPIKKGVRQKINEIFASPNYIYKANVKITVGDEVFSKRIIGRNQKYLITMNNETILIDDIKDIEIE